MVQETIEEEVQPKSGRLFIKYIIPETTIATTPLPPKWTGILAVPLIVFALLCCPPVMHWIYPQLFPVDLHEAQAFRTQFLPWTEFTRIISEVLLAVFVGGQVFNDAVRNSIKRTLERLQELLDTSTNEQRAELARRANNALDVLEDWLFGRTGVRHKIRRSWDAYNAIIAFRNVVWRDVKWLYLRLITIRIYYLFPGGMYGLLAYVFFFLILLSKCFKFYLDYGISR